jgi:ribosome maturation factor RimP
MLEEADIAARVEALLAGPIAAAGCRLLEVQYRQEGRWVLRLIVDRAPTVGLDELSAVSELAGRLLDVEDFIPHAYSLEVSSPGIFRPLREPRHFQQSIGKQVRLTLAAGFQDERRQRTLRGVIEAVEGETVRLASGEEVVQLPVSAIRSARLDPDL